MEVDSSSFGDPSRVWVSWLGVSCHSFAEARADYYGGGSPNVSADDFDRLVTRALRRIPRRFRRRLENVVLVVEKEPARPGLLGLYQGRPLTHRSVSESFAFPDRITIYQGPHERLARNLNELEEIVSETVWHEIAHYFGMDEARVRRAERRRNVRLR